MTDRRPELLSRVSRTTRRRNRWREIVVFIPRILAGEALPPSHIPIKGNYYKSGPSQGDILHDELWKYKLVWYSGYIADFLIVTKGLGFKRGSSTFFICTK
jgi:hypothetical protein